MEIVREKKKKKTVGWGGVTSLAHKECIQFSKVRTLLRIELALTQKKCCFDITNMLQNEKIQRFKCQSK